jgi:hypothetical protein
MSVPILGVNFSVALASYQTPPAMADEPHICPRGPLPQAHRGKFDYSEVGFRTNGCHSSARTMRGIPTASGNSQ